MKRPFISACIVFTVAFATVQTASANPYRAGLRQEFELKRRALNQSHRATIDAIQCQYRDAVRQLTAARRDAARLHQPERGCALDRIKSERRAVLFAYRQQLDVARRNHQIAERQLKHWYEVASRRVGIHHQVAYAPTCPSAHANPSQWNNHRGPLIPQPGIPFPNQPFQEFNVPEPIQPQLEFPATPQGPVFPQQQGVEVLPELQTSQHRSADAFRQVNHERSVGQDIVQLLRVVLANR